MNLEKCNFDENSNLNSCLIICCSVVSASIIINSLSMDELWKCLTKITDPSAVHIGILMHLNDSR